MTLFFAMLALLANAVTVALVAARLAQNRIRAAATLLGELSPLAVPAAAVVAVTATLGSLYLSEIAGFPPCELCWFQRIAMYPLAAILVVAAIRSDRAVRPYATVLALAGLPVSLFHLAVERVPSLSSSSCDPVNPCSVIWVEHFGFVTIPYMAASGFALVLALLWTTTARARPVEGPDSALNTSASTNKENT